MRRALLLSAGIVVAAFAIYAAAGWWIAPRFVRDALLDQAAARGIELRIADVRTNPFTLAVELQGVEALGPGGRKIAAVGQARADLAWSSLWGSRWRVQSLSLQQPVVFAPMEMQTAEGESPGGRAARFVVDQLRVSEGMFEYSADQRHVRLGGLEIEARALSSTSGEAAQYRAAGRAASGGTLSSEGRITLEPLAIEGRLTASALDLPAVMRLAWPPIEPAPGQVGGTAAFTYADGGFAFERLALEAAERDGPARAKAQGAMRFAPFRTDLEVKASGVGPTYVRRWLPEGFRPNLVSGTLALNGRLSETRYEGAVAIEGLRLDEGDSGNLLLAWERLSTDAAKLEFAPFALELGEVLARAPEARLVIEAGGAVNFVEAFAGDGADGGEPLRLAVSRVGIEQGVVHFADHSLETPFRATIHDLKGTITGFTPARDDPALVALSGAVDKYGAVEIGGSINLVDPLEHADLRAQFRNVGLAQLTPYVAKFAGYRVRSGRLSADLHYQVLNGELVGRNDLVFRELQLGEKVEREGLKSLPLDLMVALLADAEGRIDLDIPVTGSLSDPQFDFGGLLARAIAGAVGKIVTAPFRALANLFGGDDGDGAPFVGQVTFPPGSAELPPPQAQNVAAMAKALGARPRLGVAVHGGYDAQRDAAALRAEAVRRQILRRAGYESGGPLDFSDPKILEAARAVYKERIGKTAAQDPQQLVDALVQRTTLEGDAVQQLARKRAQSVAAALVDHGVEPARIATTVRQGKPTELELATVTSPALAQDALVEAAQRELKAAGFAAGPVDGILGPRTEAALRAFQHATYLEVSGALDAATLNALGLESAAAGANR